jgi:hypothetical protein
MRRRCSSQIVLLGGIALLLFSFLTACERPLQTITYENDTQSTIQTNAVPVQKDWNGQATFKWDGYGVNIKPGQTQAFVTSVSPVRTPAKYLVQAIDQNNKLVFSKIFTWDELHDSGWKVIIKSTGDGMEPTDNATMKQAQLNLVILGNSR